MLKVVTHFKRLFWDVVESRLERLSNDLFWMQQEFFLPHTGKGQFCKLRFSLILRHKCNMKSSLKFRNVAPIAFQMLLAFKKCGWIYQHNIILKYVILQWFCLTIYSISVRHLDKLNKKQTNKSPVDSWELGLQKCMYLAWHKRILTICFFCSYGAK